tara:strand:- start:836 stop:1420 length:585 start_codon:yes stop_codon:yes gene_type:complete
MSYYPLLPHPTFDEVDYATWEDGFTDEECNTILRLGESMNSIDSTVSGEVVVDSIRRSTNSWLPLNNDTEWIYNRLGNIVRNLNGMHWRFNITGFNEDLQYTKYNGDKSFYGWHIDSGTVGESPPRKLSVTLQLSDENEYEGGDFQIHATKLNTLSKKKGLIVVFPSYSLHQVTPVTKGIRRSLVAWLCGPPLK